MSLNICDVSVWESVVHWLKGGGLRLLTAELRDASVKGLLKQLQTLSQLPTEEERFVCGSK